MDRENGKSELPLDSLEIKGYRCFEHLTIEKLGRVNLIVGKNNVGKTALLEALWIYTQGSYGQIWHDILLRRNEIPPPQNGNILIQPESSKGLRNLFFNRPSLDFKCAKQRIEIGKKSAFSAPISENLPSHVATIVGMPASSPQAMPQIAFTPVFCESGEHYFVEAGGLNGETLVEFWDNIERLVSEDLVIKALRLIEPAVIDIRFSGYPSGSFARVPVVRLKDAKERVPLRSLGEGMTRLLGIASVLVNCKDGMLIIDEIETGLHYSVLPDVWKLIFHTAKELNVQVFATTHSKDCVEAFATAAVNSPEDGMLIRLERHGAKIVAKAIEEERLADALDYEVEVR